MKETRNILGWFGMAEEHEIIKEFEKHAEEICKTVGFLGAAVRAYVNGDLSAKTIAIENVKNSEHLADLIRQQIIHELSEGLLLPPNREELMTFSRKLDKIADTTNAAARLLGFIEHRLPDDILKNISVSTELIATSITSLREAIAAMSKGDHKTALLSCEEVDRYEHEADDQKKTLIESIIRAKLDATSVILSFNLAETLETVTDRIENVSDMVKMLIVKSK